MMPSLIILTIVIAFIGGFRLGQLSPLHRYRLIRFTRDSIPCSIRVPQREWQRLKAWVKTHQAADGLIIHAYNSSPGKSGYWYVQQILDDLKHPK